MLYCSACGAKNDDKANFCLNCGSRMLAATVVTNPQQVMAAAAQPAQTMPPPPPAALPITAPADTVPGPPQASGKAVAALICGIANALFMFFFFPLAILAIVFGHISRAEIKKSNGRLTGGGMAMTGLILGYGSVAIIPILIIAAIAIPNLLAARTSANEASAVGAIRTLNTATITYQATYTKYPMTLAAMGGVEGGTPTEEAAGLIDQQLASGMKSGYIFTYTPKLDENGVAIGYSVTADPATPGTTGRRSFFSDETAVIRESTSGQATAESPPLQ
jgi:type II secretory pathway pseudopilin PulG/DNA-directed RNA polymerase subunit RPC12/RpoP